MYIIPSFQLALTRLDCHLICHYITPGREKVSMHKLSFICFNKVNLRKKLSIVVLGKVQRLLHLYFLDMRRF